MLKSKVILEHKVNDRVYEFVCSPESPLGEAYDAVCLFREYLIKRINETKEQESSAEGKVDEKE